MAEKKELVLMHYRLSYSLDIAFMMAGIDDDEKKLLLADDSFMFRVAFEDAQVRQKIMVTLLNCMQSPDEKLARTAAMDLGKLLDKERFSGKEETNPSLVPDSIILRGKEAPLLSTKKDTE